MHRVRVQFALEAWQSSLFPTWFTQADVLYYIRIRREWILYTFPMIQVTIYLLFSTKIRHSQFLNSQTFLVYAIIKSISIALSTNTDWNLSEARCYVHLSKLWCVNIFFMKDYRDFIIIIYNELGWGYYIQS